MAALEGYPSSTKTLGIRVTGAAIVCLAWVPAFAGMEVWDGAAEVFHGQRAHYESER
jgi:hypothetical protein